MHRAYMMMNQLPFTSDNFAAPWPLVPLQQAMLQASISEHHQSRLFTLMQANSQINAELNDLLRAILAQKAGQLPTPGAIDLPRQVGHHGEVEIPTVHSQLIFCQTSPTGSSSHVSYAMPPGSSQDHSSALHKSNTTTRDGLVQGAKSDIDLLQTKKRLSSPMTVESASSSDSEHRGSKQQRCSLPLFTISANDDIKKSITSTGSSFGFRQYFMACIFDLGLESARPKKIYFKMMADPQTARAVGAGTDDKDGIAHKKGFTPNVVKSHLQRFRSNVVTSRMEVFSAIYEVLQEKGPIDVKPSQIWRPFKTTYNQISDDFSEGDAIHLAMVGTGESMHLESDLDGPHRGAFRFRWTDELHTCFTASIFELGLVAAKPAMLYKKMTTDPRFASFMNSNDLDAAFVKKYFAKFRNTIYSRELFATEMANSIRQATLKKKELGPQCKILNPEYHVYPFYVASNPPKLPKALK